MNTTTKIVLGLTVAAAAGAAIGMLLAPEKGSDLQKKLKEGANDWLSNFSALLMTGKEFVTDLKSRTEDESEEANATRLENA